MLVDIGWLQCYCYMYVHMSENGYIQIVSNLQHENKLKTLDLFPLKSVMTIDMSTMAWTWISLCTLQESCMQHHRFGLSWNQFTWKSYSFNTGKLHIKEMLQWALTWNCNCSRVLMSSGPTLVECVTATCNIQNTFTIKFAINCPCKEYYIYWDLKGRKRPGAKGGGVMEIWHLNGRSMLPESNLRPPWRHQISMMGANERQRSRNHCPSIFLSQRCGGHLKSGSRKEERPVAWHFCLVYQGKQTHTPAEQQVAGQLAELISAGLSAPSVLHPSMCKSAAHSVASLSFCGSPLSYDGLQTALQPILDCAFVGSSSQRVASHYHLLFLKAFNEQRPGGSLQVTDEQTSAEA